MKQHIQKARTEYVAADLFAEWNQASATYDAAHRAVGVVLTAAIVERDAARDRVGRAFLALTAAHRLQDGDAVGVDGRIARKRKGAL